MNEKNILQHHLALQRMKDHLYFLTLLLQHLIMKYCGIIFCIITIARKLIQKRRSSNTTCKYLFSDYDLLSSLKNYYYYRIKNLKNCKTKKSLSIWKLFSVQ